MTTSKSYIKKTLIKNYRLSIAHTVSELLAGNINEIIITYTLDSKKLLLILIFTITKWKLKLIRFYDCSHVMPIIIIS